MKVLEIVADLDGCTVAERKYEVIAHTPKTLSIEKYSGCMLYPDGSFEPIGKRTVLKLNRQKLEAGDAIRRGAYHYTLAPEHPTVIAQDAVCFRAEDVPPGWIDHLIEQALANYPEDDDNGLTAGDGE